MKKSSPLFLVSLPRSGSTLLQRLLMTSTDIKSSSEPWLLFPLFKYFSDCESVSDYSDKLFKTALKDLKNESNIEELLYEKLGKGIEDVYNSLSDNHRYFLDKTPRYANYLPELKKLIPDAKIIILYRNPLSIISSMSNTWSSGKWNIFRFYFDLYNCQKTIDDFLSDHKEDENVFVLKYEDLTDCTEFVVNNIENFLELKLDISNFNNQTSKLTGSLGDKVGISKYDKIKKANELDLNVNTFIRKRWCKQYISWIEDELTEYPYNVDELNEIVSSLEVDYGLKSNVSDLLRELYSPIARYLIPEFILSRFKKNKPELS